MIEIKEGYKDSEVGVIPVGREVVELKDIAKITMGQSPKSNTYNTENIGIPLIQGNADCKNRKTIPRTYTTELTKECFVGDIVMTVRAPVGAISKSLHNACIGRGVCSIKSKKDNEYIYHCLVAYEDKWDKLSQGSTFTAVSGSDIKNLKIPLPPLKEQEKIADILSTADDKIDAIASQIQKAETLKKGLLQKLLSEGIPPKGVGTLVPQEDWTKVQTPKRKMKDSELGKIPESWEVVELPHISNKITSGGTPSRKKAEYFENGTVNWIKTGELRDCYIYNSKEKITEEAVNNSSAKVFPIDTLLIAMYGATIGRTAYLKTECSTNQACCAIIFNQSIADPYFYWKYFHFIKDDLISQGRGAGQPNISQSIIKTLLVPLPPLKEQKQIANILSTADEKLEVLRAKKQMYETLKKGLLQKLLSGEVRV